MRHTEREDGYIFKAQGREQDSTPAVVLACGALRVLQKGKDMHFKFGSDEL